MARHNTKKKGRIYESIPGGPLSRYPNIPRSPSCLRTRLLSVHQQIQGPKCRRCLVGHGQGAVAVQKGRQNSRNRTRRIWNRIRCQLKYTLYMRVCMSIRTAYLSVGISSKPISKKICLNSARTLLSGCRAPARWSAPEALKL